MISKQQEDCCANQRIHTIPHDGSQELFLDGVKGLWQDLGRSFDTRHISLIT